MQLDLESLELCNHNARLRFPKLPSRVHIWDETLRDGEQTPGICLSPQQKLEIAQLLDEIGVEIITAGYPAASKIELSAVKLIAAEGLRAKIAAPARALLSDIDACIKADVDEIPIFVFTSKLGITRVLKLEPDQLISKLVDCIDYVNQHGIIPDFVAMDGSRSQLGFLSRIFQQAARAGAQKLCLADTVGFLIPQAVRILLGKLRSRVPQLNSIHCHDDFGLATANTLAGVEQGIIYPHTSVNGYGERAGNAPLEEVVMALELLYNVRTGIKLDKLYELSQQLESQFKIPVPIHKPIVGYNCFSHQAGIHVHAQLLNPLCFEPFDPKLVGREREYSLGKFSGSAALRFKLAQRGVQLSPEKLRMLLEKVKLAHQLKSKHQIFEQVKSGIQLLREGITDSEFWKMVQGMIDDP